MDLTSLQSDIEFLKSRIEIAEKQQENKLIDNVYNVAYERVITDYYGRIISLYDRILKLKDGISIGKIIDELATKSVTFFVPHIQSNLAKEEILSSYYDMVKNFTKTIQDLNFNEPENTTNNA